MINIKTEKEIELMRQSAEVMKKVLKAIKEEVKEGVTTSYLDFIAEKVMKEVGMLNKVHEELITLENRVKKELAEKSTLRAGAIEDFDPGDF